MTRHDTQPPAQPHDGAVPDTTALSMAALSQDMPEFATVMRGYDRGQVEDYVARLHDFLHDAEQRAVTAMRRQAQSEHRIARLEQELGQARQAPGVPEQLGQRLTEILRLAGEEAADVRASARAQADELVQGARTKAQAQLEEAGRRAEQQLQQAREHAERLVAEARQESEAVRVHHEKSLADLTRRRDEVAAELERVREILASLGLSAGKPAQPAEQRVEGRPGTPQDPNAVIDLTDRQTAGTS